MCPSRSRPPRNRCSDAGTQCLAKATQMYLTDVKEWNRVATRYRRAFPGSILTDICAVGSPRAIGILAHVVCGRAGERNWDRWRLARNRVGSIESVTRVLRSGVGIAVGLPMAVGAGPRSNILSE